MTIPTYSGPAVPVYPSSQNSPPRFSPGATPNPQTSRSQVLEYWHAIRGNLLWILVLALGGAAAGWLAAQLQQPMYQSRTLLDIRSLNENFLSQRDGASTGTTQSILPEAYIQTEIKILQSDSIRKRALIKIPVPKDPMPQPAPSGWMNLKVPPQKELVADAGRRVKVRAIGNTRMVEVFCDARDGQLAATVCNMLARTYIENNLESRYQSTKETSDWLASQLDDVRRRLTKAEEELKTAGKDFEIGADAGGSPALEKLRSLQADLARTQSERIIKESNYNIATTHSWDSLPVELDAAIRDYRFRLADLKRQYAELRGTLTPEHYRLKELSRQITEADAALQRERQNLISRLKADVDLAASREKVIAAAHDQQVVLVSRRDDKAVRYNMIKHEVDSERRLYETLLQKVGEVGLATAMRASTITVVDPAVAAVTPYSPNLAASLGLGLGGGIILGLVTAMVRYRSDRTLRAPGETTAYLRLRELGVIPSARNGMLGIKARRGRKRAPGLYDSLLAITHDPRERTLTTTAVSSPAMTTWQQAPNFAEAFFATMNSLLLSTRGTIDNRVIVTTSPDAGDGKTTVASNLAIALAQIGRRVVIVDGDLRRPRLHTTFRLTVEGGLSDYLNQESDQRPLASDLIMATELANLFVIPTNPAAEHISLKLHSAPMHQLVKTLREAFDVVIIDSPPMLHVSDARVLGSMSDGVLLVFRARKTTIEDAYQVYGCLLQDGIRVLGTVLNDWDPRERERSTNPSYSFRVA